MIYIRNENILKILNQSVWFLFNFADERNFKCTIQKILKRFNIARLIPAFATVISWNVR